ncbi:hypothetical protein [Microbacterium sp.]|uniref:hypothetical protein n=1 Tax=Microbacterium sp. TaxID=51671 RepID=UPI002733D0AD|nr:hypothetical protein [Microbacterium sp.]MDP3952608.1 hypothetical protein [Microbacterium sp.]
MTASTYSRVREGLKNVASRPVLSALLALASVAVAGATLSLSVFESSSIVAQERALREQGAYTLQMYAASGAPLPAERCDALRDVDGVVSAGGVLSTQTIYPKNDSGVGRVLAMVTPGMVEIIWPAEGLKSTTGLIAGKALSQHFGLRDEAWIGMVGESPLKVGAATESSARDENYDNRLVEVAPPIGTITSCYLEAVAGAAVPITALSETWFDPSLDVSVAPVFVADSTATPPQQRLDERVARLASWSGAAVMVSIFLLTWRSRRGDFALYRSLGLRRGDLTMILTTECVVLLVTPMAVAFLTLLAYTEPEGLVLQSLLLDAAKLLIVCIVTPPLALAAVWSRSASQAIKDSP